jgi:hypothetical protein
MMTPIDLWKFLPLGFLLTVLIETPILLFGLSRAHSLRRKLFAALWLNACSYPVVILVLPLVLANAPGAIYVTLAEVFAPVSECALFRIAFGESREPGSRSIWRDYAVIVAANLASFLLGEILPLRG